ncbi:MAG: zinc ribbon domain-containing protein [Deltaproteobacteria bacterium]|nr:zinc ribbon domain-containing protein [Deltaproteobacteria bacterium]
MPIYEYRCKKCKHEFEELRFSGDRDSDVVCPKCGKKAAERMMSVFGGKGGSCGSCTSCSPSSSFT